MGHKIVEAVIENGVLKYVNKKLPPGKITVHIIYDENKELLKEAEGENIVKETSGIYKNINAEAESKKLRDSWERNAR
jgi:predicted DNA-binding antitoxin AbrB/MazE fold protein